jgi:hypothetical protein
VPARVRGQRAAESDRRDRGSLAEHGSQRSGRKVQGLPELASLTDYVLVDSIQPVIAHYTREPDGSWRVRFVDPDGALVLRSLEVESAVSELYRNVLTQA